MASKKRNSFPKKCNGLRKKRQILEGTYEGCVAAALRKELGGSHRAVKTLIKWTGASPRTAQNWLSGAVGPSGAHLLMLLGYSDAVFDAVLLHANRHRPTQNDRVAGARLLLADAMSLLND